MTFPSATSTIYRDEVGEVIGWDGPSYDEPHVEEDPYYYDENGDCDVMVCTEHKGFANDCPKYHTDSLVHEDDLCCGPSGCCSDCCGTDADRVRGEWHNGCEVGA